MTVVPSTTRLTRLHHGCKGILFCKKFAKTYVHPLFSFTIRHMHAYISLLVMQSNTYSAAAGWICKDE